jgi:hypothetical protein
MNLERTLCIEEELHDLIYEYINSKNFVEELLNRSYIWNDNIIRYYKLTKECLFDLGDRDEFRLNEDFPAVFFDQNILFYGVFNEIFGNTSIFESDLFTEPSTFISSDVLFSKKITYPRYIGRSLIILWDLERKQVLFYKYTERENKRLYYRLLDIFKKHSIRGKLKNFLYTWFSTKYNVSEPSFNKNLIALICRKYVELWRSDYIDFKPTKYDKKFWKKQYPMSELLLLKNVEEEKTSIYINFSYSWVIDQENYDPIIHEFCISPIKIDTSRLLPETNEAIKKVLNKIELNTIGAC